jgi:hypothetical protein
MRTLALQKTALGPALGALVAATLAISPVKAEGNGFDAVGDVGESHMLTSTYIHLRTMYHQVPSVTPTYVGPNQATYTTTKPDGSVTTTTYTSPGIAQLPAPAVAASTTIMTPQPCHPTAISRAGVSNPCMVLP